MKTGRSRGGKYCHDSPIMGDNKKKELDEKNTKERKMKTKVYINR